MQVLGDPEEGVEVAKTALPLLDVRLDHVTAGAGAGVAIVPLLELGGDELGPRALDHVVLEAPHQVFAELLVAGQPSRLQDRGADGEVLAGELDALFDRSRSVSDLKAQVPQGV